MKNIGKLGASVDSFFILLSFFSFALLMLIMILVWNNVDGLTALWGASSIGASVNTNVDNTILVFDFILICFWLAFHIGVIVLAFLLRTHPVVFFASVLLCAILVMVAAPMSNAWETIITNTALSVSASSIPITNFVMSKLPLFEAIWGFLTIMITYASARSY